MRMLADRLRAAYSLEEIHGYDTDDVVVIARQDRDAAVRLLEERDPVCRCGHCGTLWGYLAICVWKGCPCARPNPVPRGKR